MQLTYGQYLIEKNREQAIRTSPSDDDTNYENINWYNDMKTSFANKELADLVKEICNFVSLFDGNSRCTTAILIGKLFITTMKIMQCEVNKRDRIVCEIRKKD